MLEPPPAMVLPSFCDSHRPYEIFIKKHSKPHYAFVITCSLTICYAKGKAFPTMPGDAAMGDDYAPSPVICNIRNWNDDFSGIFFCCTVNMQLYLIVGSKVCAPSQHVHGRETAFILL